MFQAAPSQHNLTTTLTEDFFGIVPPAPPDHEDKLIKDGNDLIQKELEKRKKSRDYARNQISRDRPRSTNLSMSFVDWSGFPAAAHSPTNLSERKRLTLRRNSLNNEVPVEENTASAIRSRRRASCGPVAPSYFEEEDGMDVAPTGASHSAQKIRSRRHINGRSGGSPEGSESSRPGSRNRSSRRVASLDQGGSHHSSKSGNKRSHLDQGGSLHRGSGHHRIERRLSGNHRGVERKPSGNLRGVERRIPDNHRAERRGSGHQTIERRNSGKVSRAPRRMSNQGPQPVSPSGRVRRSSQAAASSTTLEVSRRPPSRGSSNMRRTERRGSGDGSVAESITRAHSLRW